jgi:NADH pyrophosphatase NudC (nudix superfamily)
MLRASLTTAVLSLTAALRAPLFDTQGRLQRTAAPPAPLPEGQHRYVAVYNGEVLVTGDDAVDARFLDQQEAAPLVDEGSIVAWLGTLQSKGYWLLDVSHNAQAPAIPGAAWAPLRSPRGDRRAVLSRPAAQLPAGDSCALLVTASGLGRWHRAHMYCAACGAKTSSAKHGRQRKCEKCAAVARPRVDPSSIVLVASPDNTRVLLGRKAAWPEGKWSTLAGFVEFGESLEECACREVLEESGLEVDRSTLTHVASQPWPFPSSLMVGYSCRARTEAIVVDDELEAVAWFDRDFVSRAARAQGDRDAPVIPGGFHVPTTASLARVLIDRWVEEEAVVVVDAGADAAPASAMSLAEARAAATSAAPADAAQAWELVDELERAAKGQAPSSLDECAVDDADEKCQKMAKDLAELSMLMAVGPDKDGVQQAARSMLRALETRYDNKMFDP